MFELLQFLDNIKIRFGLSKEHHTFIKELLHKIKISKIYGVSIESSLTLIMIIDKLKHLIYKRLNK
ncbi:MAG: hypothetical protein Tsb0014_29770 [Pleurocapsa sp.]